MDLPRPNILLLGDYASLIGGIRLCGAGGGRTSWNCQRKRVTLFMRHCLEPLRWDQRHMEPFCRPGVCVLPTRSLQRPSTSNTALLGTRWGQDIAMRQTYYKVKDHYIVWMYEAASP